MFRSLGPRRSGLSALPAATVPAVTVSAVTLVTGIGAIWFPGSAEAAQGRGAVFGVAGVGGEVEADLDLDGAFDPDSDRADMDVTLGIGASYDFAIAEVFALGGLGRFFRWEADNYEWEVDGENEGLGGDLSLLPRLHFRVEPVELNITMPFGLTLMSKDDNRVTLFAVDSQYDMGVGWNWGLFAGVTYPLGTSVSLLGEVGWLVRDIDQHGEARNDSGADGDLEATFSQLTFNVGVAFR